MKSRYSAIGLRSLGTLVTRPRIFFATRFHSITAGQASGFLILSALFSAVTGSLLNPGTRMATGVILFANAVAMVMAGAAIGYVAMVATTGRRYPFARLWNVFSLSSGAVLLIAWVPSAFLLTEPWKWWLIATGMVNGLGMSKVRAAIVTLFTFGALVMLVYALLPLAGSWHR
jgi:hypothetical protein